MTKILIYEDNEQDLVRRYSNLTTKHDVYVRHPLRPLMGVGMLSWNSEEFRQHGFNPNNFQEGYGNPKDEKADVYFLDGLDGYCFEIIRDLPRDQAYINSDNSHIVDQAKKEGYRIVDDSVDKIVNIVLFQQAFKGSSDREIIRQIEAKALRGLRHPSQRRKKF